MVDVVRRYICDVCESSFCVDTSADESLAWTVKTEVGDLCPDCERAWEELKESFITRMKKEHRKDLV